MIEVRKTEIFRKWMKNLKDLVAKAHIDRRIFRLSQGNPGDVKPVGDGVFEMRIFMGLGTVYIIR